MGDDCVQHYELEWIQEQIWELERKIEEFQMENTLLRNELNEIKHEGCALSKNILMRFTDDGK